MARCKQKGKQNRQPAVAPANETGRMESGPSGSGKSDTRFVAGWRMRVDQLLATCSVLGRYYNREASDNIRNHKLIHDENAKKRGLKSGKNHRYAPQSCFK